MAEMSRPEAIEGQSQASADERPVYEVSFHIVSGVGEENIAGVVEKIRAELKKADAEFISEQFPQKTTLAYTVERVSGGKREKYNEAYFGFIKFAVEREIIPVLQTMLRSFPEVLRFLVVETVREELVLPRRAVFTSDRLSGETIKKPISTPEKGGEVSDEELDKSIEALVS